MLTSHQCSQHFKGAISVTNLFNICPSTTIKIFTIPFLCQSCLKNCQMQEKIFKKSANVTKFCKIWSHWMRWPFLPFVIQLCFVDERLDVEVAPVVTVRLSQSILNWKVWIKVTWELSKKIPIAGNHLITRWRMAIHKLEKASILLSLKQRFCKRSHGRLVRLG